MPGNQQDVPACIPLCVSVTKSSRPSPFHAKNASKSQHTCRTSIAAHFLSLASAEWGTHVGVYTQRCSVFPPCPAVKHSLCAYRRQAEPCSKSTTWEHLCTDPQCLTAPCCYWLIYFLLESLQPCKPCNMQSCHLFLQAFRTQAAPPSLFVRRAVSRPVHYPWKIEHWSLGSLG